MNRSVAIAILAISFSGLQAQTITQQPKLVVSLTIDQLRTDYLEMFSPLFGQQGFNRLLQEGRVYKQVTFSFDAQDRASAMTALGTGTTPSVNGIIAEDWIDKETDSHINCTYDPTYMGNYTNDSSSPSKILTSTISDELKIATRGQALVYSIAPYRDAAIISAGHAANCAFWIDENTGKWCSTTYYKDFPWWLSSYNDTKAPDSQIKEMVWQPVFPVGSYDRLPQTGLEPFKYNLNDDKINRFRKLISSPFVNEEVNRLAEELITKSDMGKHGTTDMLSLTYYCGNYAHKSSQELPMELQDMYVRVDRCIAQLFDIIDRKVGLQNVLLYVCSTGSTDKDNNNYKQYNIPGGDFYLNRCATLLNMYLMATYGEGQYIESYYNQQIYLNTKLIEKKNLVLADIQEKAAEFLVQFSGIDEVYTSNRLLFGALAERGRRIRNGYHKKRSGDIVVEVLPGWTIVDEEKNERHIVNKAEIPSPFILFDRNAKAETIDTPIKAEQIAPTVANALHIRAPNGCQTPSLVFRKESSK